MNFTSASVPYVWVWWTAAFLYHPAVVGLQKIAPALKPWQSLIRQAWGVWNISFSLLSVTLHGSTLRYAGRLVVDLLAGDQHAVVDLANCDIIS